MTAAARYPLALVVLDGWGLSSGRNANAIALARTPVYTGLLARFPHAKLVASGEEVGLPPGQIGNSEVGHMNMGAGRIVWQDLTRIDKAIREGDFFTNPALTSAMDRCRDGRHAVHLLGLVSDGGVHSHERHLNALVEMAARRKVRNLFVQAITDGRDTPPIGGVEYLGRLGQKLAKEGVGQLASVVGRYYAMDRDRRWERTRLAYEAIVMSAARPVRSAVAALQESYAQNVTDEFVKPVVIVDAHHNPVGPIRDGDSVIFFNFRADRARQLTRALAFEDFDGFVRYVHPKVHFASMTAYDATFQLPVAFEPQLFTGALAEVLGQHSLSNLRLAETEKYAHVTYFFNCGEERPYPGEDRLLVPSPKVATYDLQPEMSAPGITAELVKDVEARRHQVIICNFANADMVGHTGNLEAAIRAVETLDGCVGRIAETVQKAGGTLLVTADHGNAEQMWDAENNCPHTAHTSNPVPLILVDEAFRGSTLRDGVLRDVAPTMLGVLGIEPPKEMSGKNLLES
jgi:2,3-bisphosphoglycerate-independent phosphoglycerate mutase